MTEQDVEQAATRDALVPLYAALIQEMVRSSQVPDVQAVNLAIIEKWSPSGLNYIKHKAWKLAEIGMTP